MHELWQTYLTVAVVAYLLGSIPFGYILVKLFLKQDIRTTGSGNIGATNVARSGKKGLAIATLLMDAGKGFAAVMLSIRIYFATTLEWGPFSGPSLAVRDEIMAFAALVAILGHMFPIWLRFKGGKGVATGVGAFYAFNLAATGMVFLAFLLIFAVTRIVSLSSIIATLLFPLVLIVLPFSYSPRAILFASLASVAIIAKHHSNIRRLVNGTEPKFGMKKATPADPIQVEKNA